MYTIFCATGDLESGHLESAKMLIYKGLIHEQLTSICIFILSIQPSKVYCMCS